MFTPLLLTANVSIFQLDGVASRDEIDCPGDILRYNCSIMSNSESIHLTWRVTFPGQMPINVTYSNVTNDLTNLNMYTTTSLTEFQNDEYVHSTLEITVQPDIPTDFITSECLISDLGHDTVFTHVNISGEFLSFSSAKKLSVLFKL